MGVIEWAYGEYEYLGIVGEREIKNILRMRRVVIGLLSVNALMILAQISSDDGIREHSRNRRGLEELSRNRRTLLPILRKLRELKERGLSSVLEATSNICTAQALLANISAMYAVYHGPQGLEDMARKIHNATLLLAKGLRESGNEIENPMFFDTLKISPRLDMGEIKIRAQEVNINLRYYADGCVGVSLDETVGQNDIKDLLWVFQCPKTIQQVAESVASPMYPEGSILSSNEFQRTSPYMTHPVFNTHHSETDMVRYMKRLENKDVSLVHSMIPLGSCTMK